MRVSCITAAGIAAKDAKDATAIQHLLEIVALVFRIPMHYPWALASVATVTIHTRLRFGYIGHGFQAGQLGEPIELRVCFVSTIE